MDSIDNQIQPRGSHKFIEFGVLIVAAIVLIKIILWQSGDSLNGRTAGAFEWEKDVNIYLANFNMGSGNDCSEVFPVKRRVPNAEILGPSALDALLNGPLPEERAKGYESAINDGVIIQKFDVENGVAYVDFNSKFSEVGGSCKVIAIRSQIEKTIDDLPGLNGAVISVNGKTEGILEP
jgi:hypothetical protein